MSEKDGLKRNAIRALASVLGTRRWLSNKLGLAFGGERDYYEVLGYNRNPDVVDFMARYDRQDIAGRIVDLPP